MALFPGVLGGVKVEERCKIEKLAGRLDFDFQFFDTRVGCQERVLVVIIAGQQQNIFASPTDHVRWEAEELMTQSLHGGSNFIRWQAQSFEPVDQVVGQQ